MTINGGGGCIKEGCCNLLPALDSAVSPTFSSLVTTVTVPCHDENSIHTAHIKNAQMDTNRVCDDVDDDDARNPRLLLLLR